MKVRKLLTVVEEIQEDGGRRLEKPLRKIAAIAVIANPFAGRYVEDLQELVKTGEELQIICQIRKLSQCFFVDLAALHQHGEDPLLASV